MAACFNGSHRPTSFSHFDPVLLTAMTETTTFPDRLKAGVPTNWSLAHKTGISGSWHGVTAATDDVGVLRVPDGDLVALVVFLPTRAWRGRKERN
jgi:beta-lactamase class A